MKNILITGSTDGIGKLVAIQLAKEGHAVYVHGRNGQKLADTLATIREVSNNKQVKGYQADFSDLTAVREMANQLKKDLPHLDILINNAGIFTSPVSTNKDGMDIRLVVNYLAPYLLTQELLPLLQKHQGERIINLGSAAQSPVIVEAFTDKRPLTAQAAYAQSKLALTMWSFYFAKQLQDTQVIVVNPGSLLNTKMAQQAYGQHWSPANKGADILYDLALSDDYKGITGKYYDNDKGAFASAHPDAYDEKKITKLLTITNSLI